MLSSLFYKKNIDLQIILETKGVAGTLKDISPAIPLNLLREKIKSLMNFEDFVYYNEDGATQQIFDQKNEQNTLLKSILLKGSSTSIKIKELKMSEIQGKVIDEEEVKQKQQNNQQKIEQINTSPYNEIIDNDQYDTLNIQDYANAPNDEKQIQEKSQPLEFNGRVVDYQRKFDNLKAIEGYRKKVEKLDLISDDIEQMPECSEKTLFLLLRSTLNFFLQQKQLNQQELNDLNQNIQLYKRQLKDEDNELIELQKHLNFIETNFQYREWDTISDKLEKSISLIQKLNLAYLFKLVEKSMKAAIAIQNQDVFLLVGDTGSGKSTTIQFLSGCKMIKKTIGGVDHIEAQDINNPDLNEVKPQHIPVSETKYITPVRVNYKTLGFIKEGVFYLCDSPGYGDNNGFEVDIANGIGILKALQRCKSVRLLVVFSQENIGSRLTAFSSALKIIIKMIPEIKDYFSAICYIFTKFSEQEAKQILNKIESKLLNLTDEEKAIDCFSDMISNMLDENKPIFLNPLDNNAKDIVQQLQKLTTIERCDENFRFSITENSQSAIRDQINIHQKQIYQSIKRADYQFMKYKLDQIKQLYEILEYNYILTVYDEIISVIKNHLYNQFQQSQKQFEFSLQQPICLTKNDIDFFIQNQKSNQIADTFLKIHLSDQVIKSTVYEQYLSNYQEQCIQQMMCKQLEDLNLKVCLNNIKISEIIFPNQNSYLSKGCNIIKQLFEDQKVQFSIFIKNKQFKMCAKQLQNIDIAIRNFKDYFNEDELATIGYFQDYLLVYLADMQSKFRQILFDNVINEEESQYLQEYVEILEDITYIFSIEKISIIEKIEKIKNDTINELMEKFDTRNKIIQSQVECQEENFIDNVKKLYIQLKNLYHIKIIAKEKSDMYYQSLDLLVTQIQKMRICIQDSIKSIQENGSCDSYKNLAKNIINLQRIEWIEEFKYGSYLDEIEYVKTVLLNHFQYLKGKVQQFIPIPENYKYLDISFKNIQEIKMMKTLGNTIIDFDDEINEVIEWFDNSINSQLVLNEKFHNITLLKNNEISKLNYKEIQLTILYHKKLSSLQLENAQDINIKIKNFDEFLIKYFLFGKEQIHYSVQAILNDQTPIEVIFQNIRSIKSKLKEFEEINNFPELQASFAEKYEEFFENQRKNFGKIQSELILKMELYLKSNGLFEQCLIIIAQLKAFSEIDYFMDKKFEEIHKEYYLKFYDNIKLQVDEAHKAIFLQDFKSLRDIITSLQEDDVFIRSHSNSIKKKFNDNVWQLQITLQKDVKSYFNFCIYENKANLADELNGIEESIEKTKSAKLYLGQYLYEETQEQIINNYKILNALLEEGLTQLFKKMDGYISNDKFHEAGKLSNKIKNTYQILEEFCSDGIKQEIHQDKLSSALKEIVNKYEKNEIYYLKKVNTNELFLRLQTDESIIEYKQTIDAIKLIIEKKIQIEIEKVQNKNQTQQQKFLHLNKIKGILTSLPLQLREDITQQIKQLEEDIQQYEKVLKDELQYAINHKNYYQIRDLFNDKYQSISSDLVKFVKEAVFKEAEEFVKNINNLLKDKDIISAIDELKQFYIFRKDLELSFQSEIEKSYIKVKNIFEQTIKKEFEFLDTQFSENIDVSNNVQKIDVLYQYQGDIQKQNNDLSSDMSDNENNIYDSILFLRNFINKTNGGQSEIINIYTKCTDDIIKITNKIAGYFQKYSYEINKALKNRHYLTIRNILSKLRIKERVLNFLLQEKQIFIEKGLTQFVCKIEQALQYRIIIKIIVQDIQNLKLEIQNFNFIKDTQLMLEKQRKEYYQEFKKKIDAINQIDKLENFLNSELNLAQLSQDCQTIMFDQIDKSRLKVLSYINNEKLNKSDCENFSKYFQNFQEIIEELNQKKQKYIETIEEIKNTIINKVDTFKLNAQQNLQEQNISECLIQMKMMSEIIPDFQQTINQKIGEIIQLFAQKKQSPFGIITLSQILNQDPVGCILLDEYQIFNSYLNSIFVQKTNNHDVKYVLQYLQGDNVNPVILNKRYDEYLEEYKKNVKEFLEKSKEQKFQDLILRIKNKVGQCKIKNGKFCKKTYENLPTLIAQVFALWTLKDAKGYFEAEGAQNQDFYLFQPHSAQIISIFRLLGIGDVPEKIVNNLVQIGTGEGKSIILGILSAILALLNFDVYCVCYSQDLSKRDYNSFKQLFELLDIQMNIKYGTFNKLYELQINSKGEIRDIVEQVVQNKSTQNLIKNKIQKSKILLIDEVDVFFSQNFYGNVYTPSAKLQGPEISIFLDFIWQTKDQNLSVEQVMASQEFTIVLNQYKQYANLLEEITKDLIFDLKEFKSHEYIVKDDQICYQIQDQVVNNVKYGYKTLFAAYKENSLSLNKISMESLESNKILQIKCGSFSYAEFPRKFTNIMGVTGTLRTLSEPEVQVVEKEYEILRKTFTPSVFGKNQLNFNKNIDIKIENDNDYQNSIAREIQSRLQGKLDNTFRAVIVVFENDQLLKDFLNSKSFQLNKAKAKILTEDANSSEKNKIIQNAVLTGQITLITRSFGRGTDFKCRDQIVSNNGGIHVLTTFLSEQLSEEVQIMGRTARQGDFGSFSMILNMTSLEKFQITQDDIDQNQGRIYDLLNEKRNTYFKQQYLENSKYIDSVKNKHKESEMFLEELFQQNITNIQKYLVQFNRGQNLINNSSKTLILIDGTHSMSLLLNATKNTVQTMVDRLSSILQINQIDSNFVKLQIAIYRNYNSKELILQSSPWESKADNLRTFMESVSAQDGWVNEAIEIGLWHANNEHLLDKNGIQQVILIGDAPSNTKEDVICKRKHFGEEYWSTTKFSQITCEQTELSKLVTNKIPIHTFYVHDNAQRCFQNIAIQSGGRCEKLDVTSENGSEQLTNLVTEEILRQVGNQTGSGDKFIEQYRQKFNISFISTDKSNIIE